jgi:hypothetical protein
MQVAIHSKIVGAKQGDNLPSNISLEFLTEKITVRELISNTVEEQIRDMLINRRLDAQQAEKILNRQYLLESEISSQAKSGAIRVPSSKNAQSPSLILEREIDKALRSFERQGFMIVVDGEQVQELDEYVTLKATSKVTFMRLTPLVGG